MNNVYSKLGTVYQLPNYTESIIGVKPKTITADELLRQERERLYAVAAEIDGGYAIVTLRTAIERDVSSVRRRVDLAELHLEVIENSDSYRAALEIVLHRLSLAYEACKLVLFSQHDSELCIYYIHELDKFIMYDLRAIEHNVDSFIRHKYSASNPMNQEVKKEPTPIFKLAFINDIKIQAKNVKVSYHGNIDRYEVEDWFKELSKKIGRTPGSTIGGTLRRIRNGSFTPKDAKLYVVKKNDSERAIMSLQIGDKGGQTFFVPDQSIQMYADLVKEHFGEDKIVHLSV